MVKKILVFGASGGIGSELVSGLATYNVLAIPRSYVDFSVEADYRKLFETLSEEDPDIIINASGVFGDNSIEFSKVFDINVRSNWEIMKYYNKHLPKKKVKFVVLGSSSYDGPRKNYVLYAATKAALYSIYVSCTELFKDTNFVVGLVSPRKTYTTMISNTTGPEGCLSPVYVAAEIINFMNDLDKSSHTTI